MAAPYAEKHFLEMSDREREARRLADLERSGRDAVEGVYPEELVIPATKMLRGAGDVVKEAGQKAIRAVDMAMRPKVANEVVRPKRESIGLLAERMPQNPESVTHAYRQISPRELQDIRASKYARPDPNPEKTKRMWNADKKWWSAGDETGIFGRNWLRGKDAETIRTTVDKVPPNKAVRRKDLQILNKETGEYVPLKKGGVVKVKSHRGDGIAQRGKTKGRFV